MLQRVEGLLATLMARHTESTDTRMPMQHEDPVFARRRKNHQTHDHVLPEIDDVAEVSVSALLTFLEQELHIYHPDPVQVHPTTPVSLQAARAMRAYGGGHEATVTPPVTSSPVTSEGLDQKGQVILQRAVVDLKVLQAAGIAFLRIRRAGTFLEALIAAIADAKAALPSS